MTDKSNQDSSNKPLFRKEALQERKGSYFGKILVVAPVSFSAWTFGVFFIAVAIGLFLYFGEYSRRQTVRGELVPDKGLITLHAKDNGIVVNKYVQQGEEVKKGQLLCLISTEHETATTQSLSAQQVDLLEKQIVVQKNKIELFERNASSYTALLKKHYISDLEYQKRQDEYFSSKLALHDFEKQLNQAKGGVDYAIRAPEEGVIAALITMVGDHVNAETSLVTIIPKDSQLEGVLFVPTSKIGFVMPGQKVLLKYDAYPYQRFGLYEAIVVRVDKSILKPQDIKSLPFKMEEGFYRVIVTLAKQTVTVYGEPYPLIAGMLFDAVILGEKRNIWQWIADPIYSLKGSFKT